MIKEIGDHWRKVKLDKVMAKFPGACKEFHDFVSKHVK